MTDDMDVLCLMFLVSWGRISALALTEEEKEKIVEVHNHFRRRENATDMKRMDWDDRLATEAQKTADSCVWAQRSKEDLVNLVDGFHQVTELLDVTSNEAGIEKSTEKWAQEAQHYHYSTGQCRKVCWHYTQVVWADAYAVGCGKKYCPQVQNLKWGDHGGYLISCMYGSLGSKVAVRPFRRGGGQCSQCTDDFPYCYDGLCSRYPPTTSIRQQETSTPRVVLGKPLPIGAGTRPGITALTGLLGLLHVIGLF